MLKYESPELPKLTEQEYAESYYALERIANASEYRLRPNVMQKLTAFVSCYAYHATNVVFSDPAHTRNIEPPSSQSIPHFNEANAADMPMYREFRLGGPRDKVLRIGAGRAGVILETTPRNILGADDPEYSSSITSSIHVSANLLPEESSKVALGHWSIAEPDDSRVYPWHPYNQAPASWHSYAEVLQKLTRPIVEYMPAPVEH